MAALKVALVHETLRDADGPGRRLDRALLFDARDLAAARRDYPGYLPMRAALYARGWSEIAD